eukprot:1381233-Rhodomonas_salina.1
MQNLKLEDDLRSEREKVRAGKRLNAALLADACITTSNLEECRAEMAKCASSAVYARKKFSAVDEWMERQQVAGRSRSPSPRHQIVSETQTQARCARPETQHTAPSILNTP